MRLFGEACKQYCIKKGYTNVNSPNQNGFADRALGINQNAALAACIQAPTILPFVPLPSIKSL